MLQRWNSIIDNIKLFVSKAKKFTKKVSEKLKKKRGRPPKHNIENYLTLILAKEFDKKSLRSTEVNLSEQLCSERIDHSVIAYWEAKPEVISMLSEIVFELGKELEKHLGKDFSMIDATKFSDWHHGETCFHLVNHISEETVYPIGISFLTGSVSAPVNEAAPPGKELLYADAGYDDNKSIGILFKKGYTPIVCPNSQRWSG